MISSTSFHVFRPSDSTIIDHLSWRAIETTPDRLLTGYLDTLQPSVSGLVLRGLELVGEWASGGPPGTRRPDSQASGVRISPGSAVVSDKEGRKYILDIDEELRVQWPSSNGPAVRAALVLIPEIEPAEIDGGVVVARSNVRAKIGFVDLKLIDKPYYLPLAVSVGNGQDWATDFRRVYQPSHPVVELMIKRFERLEQTVWQAEPEGGVWDREVLGKNWFRYQTVGAAAIQATRAILMTYPTTTMERVHLLCTLRKQLQASVEQAAGELLQLVGSRDGAGPYAAVLPAPTGV